MITVEAVLWCCERGDELVDIGFTACVEPGSCGRRDRFGCLEEPDEEPYAEIESSDLPLTAEEERQAIKIALERARR